MLLIKIIAFYNFAFGLLHLFFWRLLKWNEQLKRVSPINSAIVQTLNICLTFVFFLVAYCFYFSPTEIKTTDLGSTLLIGMGLFWLIRAILQIYLYEMKQRIHKILFIIFVLGVFLHVSPLFV